MGKSNPPTEKQQSIYQKKVLGFYLGARTISLLGDRIAELVIPYLLITATGSAFIAGFVGAIEQLPTLLFALWIGIAIDRASPLKAMLTADFVRAALLREGQLIAAAEEERFYRIKHAPGRFPYHATAWCLTQAGISVDEIDAIVFGWEPTRQPDAPEPTDTDALRNLILPPVLFPRTRNIPVHRIPHHLAHAAYAFYSSPFDEAAALIVDGSGERESVSVFRCNTTGLELVWSLPFVNSPGFFVNLLQTWGLRFEILEDPVPALVDELAHGKLVGFFQGPAEIGPRALGGRSLLADPSQPNMLTRVNQLKKREMWRPLAPSLPFDEADAVFEHKVSSPFMLISYPVLDQARHAIPAAVHVDNSTRPQIVTPDLHESFYRLVSSFTQSTGIPALLNTSFNVGEPMVLTPAQAIRTFSTSPMDLLAIEGLVLRKPQ